VNRIYVYYRVPPAQAPAMRGKVAQLLREVERRTGVRGRLSCRCNDPDTWMETYEPVPEVASFANLLAELSVGWDMRAHLAAGESRQIECFSDVE
jgi:hypothetical protein